MSVKTTIALLAVFALGFFVGSQTAPRMTMPGKVTVLTCTDTLTIERPVEVSRRRTAEVAATLPSVAAPDSDSAAVLVPLESCIYEGPDYRAYVSGFRLSLDSIRLYRKVSVVTSVAQPKRWSIGLQAGYGITPHGFQPYIGLGVEFRFIAF